MFLLCCIFFFKHKTAYEMRISDWSSDVCSSDLTIVEVFGAAVTERYQIITEHRPGRIITFDSGLGEGRADDVVIVQIVQSGRTREIGRASCRDRVCQYV